MLYRQLEALAKREKRSVSSQAAYPIEKGLHLAADVKPDDAERSER